MPCKPGGGLASPLFLALLFAFVVLPATVLAESPFSGYNPGRIPFEAPGPFLRASALMANTTLPMDGYIDDSWHGPYTPTDRGRGDAMWNAAAGFIHNGFRIAAISRGELFIEANRDAQEFFYRTKRHLDLQAGKTYRVSLDGTGFAANGAELSWGLPLDSLLPGLAAGLTVRLLEARTLQEAKISGTVTATGPRSYDFRLAVNYLYGRNILYRRTDGVTDGGLGYGADLGMVFQRGGFAAEAVVRDIAGMIRWRSARYTDAAASSDNTTTGPDGYQEFHPTIHGYEGQRKFRQRIPLKTDLSVRYAQSRFDGGLTLNLVGDTPHYWLEGGVGFGSTGRVGVGYNVEYRAVQLMATVAGWELAILADHPDPARAAAVGATVAYRCAW